MPAGKVDAACRRMGADSHHAAVACAVPMVPESCLVIIPWQESAASVRGPISCCCSMSSVTATAGPATILVADGEEKHL
jgi:hypothetical protein